MKGLPYLRATGYHVICCCFRMGDYLIETRRNNAVIFTEGRFKTSWADLVKYDFGMVNLCALNRKMDRVDEDLAAARRLCIRINKNRVLTGMKIHKERKAAN